MPAACVAKLVAQGKSRAEAHRLCYPKKGKKGNPSKKSKPAY